MAGLLDFFGTDEGRASLGLLSAAGPQAQPASFFQRLQGAVGQLQQQKAADEQRRLQMQLMQAQIGETQAQAQQRAAQSQEMQRKAIQAEQAAKEQAAFYASPLRQVSTGAPSFMGGSGQATPEQNAQNQVGATRPQFDFATAARLFGPEHATKLMEGMNNARNFGMDKGTRAIDTVMPGTNLPGTMVVDDYNRQIGKVAPKAIDMKLEDLGGTKQAFNPFALIAGQEFRKTQTPDSVASNKLGWANYGLGAQRLAQEGSAGQIVETPSGYVRVGKDNAARPIAGPDGKPLMGKRADQTLTEDQGKATGWLIQADQAYKNMQEALKSTPSANRPGFPDLYEKVPLVGGAANMMRGEDRQKFIQASSSFGEAVLRAATGAGVNKDEALQKARELTPQIGDSDAVVKQKMDAFPVYIEALKVRAGPGAPKAATVGAQFSGRPAPIKFLGFE